MILVVGSNLAMDIAINVPSPRLSTLNHARSAAMSPAGKGMNVTRTLSLLGQEVRLHGFVGQGETAAFETALRELHASFELTPLPGTTRMNLKIVDGAGGEVTEFDMPGLTVSGAQLASFEDRWRARLGSAEWLVLTGSLPLGIPDATYGRWIMGARNEGIPVALDASGGRLAQGIAAGPRLVKVNWVEMEGAAGRSVSDDLEALAVLKSWHASGVEFACVTRRDALLLSTPRGRWRADVPLQEVVNPVGAGDAALAGFLAALVEGCDDAMALARAAATAAASVLTETPGQFEPGARNMILPRVKIEPVA